MVPLRNSCRVPRAPGFRPLLVQLVSTTGAAGGWMTPRADPDPRQQGTGMAAHANPAVAGGHGLLRGPALEEDE